MSDIDIKITFGALIRVLNTEWPKSEIIIDPCDTPHRLWIKITGHKGRGSCLYDQEKCRCWNVDGNWKKVFKGAITEAKLNMEYLINELDMVEIESEIDKRDDLFSEDAWEKEKGERDNEIIPFKNLS